MADSLNSLLKRADTTRLTKYKRECEIAAGYFDGPYATRSMEDDCRGHLRTRFRRQQSGQAGQDIQPVVVSLAKRFVDEQATAYNHRVEWVLVDGEGNTNEEQSTKYNRMLDDAGYQESQHALERKIVGFGGACMWPQASKNGELWPAVVDAHAVAPIAPDDGVGFNRADSDMYGGFLVDLGAYENKRRLALLTEQETTVLEGHYIGDENPRVVSTYPNEFGTVMLTAWQKTLQTGCLLPKGEPPIIAGNRELNIALSALFDIMRWQGFGQVVLNVANRSGTMAKRAYGIRTPLVMMDGESASLLQAAPTYTEQMAVLRQYVAMWAVSERLSPDDVDTEAQGASITSGVARLVANMPKIEARDERLVRLTHMEQRKAGPRNIAVGIALGKLDEVARNLRVRVRFDKVRYPETPDELSKRYETGIKYNFTTPAQLLADERRISEAEAQEIIDANAEVNGSRQDAQQPPSIFGPPQPGPLARLVGRPRSAEPS